MTSQLHSDAAVATAPETEHRRASHDGPSPLVANVALLGALVGNRAAARSIGAATKPGPVNARAIHGQGTGIDPLQLIQRRLEPDPVGAPVVSMLRDPGTVIRRVSDAPKSSYPLAPGTYVFVHVDGVWQTAMVLESRSQNLEEQRAEVAMQTPSETTLDIPSLRAGSRAAAWALEDRGIDGDTYVQHRVALLDTGGVRWIPYEDAIRLDRAGFAGKFGIGTLQTALVDTVTFGLGVNVLLKELGGIDDTTANLVLKWIGVFWGIPAGAVGIRQGYVAFADRSVRGGLQTTTLSLSGLANIVSAASGIASNIVGLISADDAWVTHLFRVSTGAWTVAQFIDLITAAAAFYAAYDEWLNTGAIVTPRTIVAGAMAIKALVGLTGGAVLTASGGAGGLAVGGFITAVVASGAGGGLVFGAKKKLKQD